MTKAAAIETLQRWHRTMASADDVGIASVHIMVNRHHLDALDLALAALQEQTEETSDGLVRDRVVGMGASAVESAVSAKEVALPVDPQGEIAQAIQTLRRSIGNSISNRWRGYPHSPEFEREIFAVQRPLQQENLRLQEQIAFDEAQRNPLLVRAFENGRRQGESTLAAQASPGWQDIESAPKDGTPVLTFDEGAITIASYVNDLQDDEQGWYDNGFMNPPPSHWMPLPAPPRRREGETA